MHLDCTKSCPRLSTAPPPARISSPRRELRSETRQHSFVEKTPEVRPDSRLSLEWQNPYTYVLYQDHEHL